MNAINIKINLSILTSAAIYSTIYMRQVLKTSNQSIAVHLPDIYNLPGRRKVYWIHIYNTPRGILYSNVHNNRHSNDIPIYHIYRFYIWVLCTRTCNISRIFATTASKCEWHGMHFECDKAHFDFRPLVLRDIKSTSKLFRTIIDDIEHIYINLLFTHTHFTNNKYIFEILPHIWAPVNIQNNKSINQLILTPKSLRLISTFVQIVTRTYLH